jgi:taurine transport system substrate-binding protein
LWLAFGSANGERDEQYSDHCNRSVGTVAIEKSATASRPPAGGARLKSWTGERFAVIMTRGVRPAGRAGARLRIGQPRSGEVSMNRKHVLGVALGLGLGALVGGGVAAETVTVGYQLIYNPWKVPIADDTFSEATGWDVEYRQFDSGAKVITAMASGDVQIALAGSSPIAAGISQGVDMQLVWIVEDIASAEALVARDGSGIEKVEDLVGKKVGVPFVSTTHFHLLFALEHFGVDPNQVEILNLQPPQIAAAWERGDIDAAFVWDPALGQIKKNGKVVITSGELSALGRPTFDGLVVNKSWAEEHQEGLAKFIKTIGEADAAYRDHKDAWTADSEPVKKIVGVVGGNPEDVPGVLALYNFPTMEEQASCAWLGCGADGGAVKALIYTSEFLKEQKKIPDVLPDYTPFVTPKYVEMAMGK